MNSLKSFFFDVMYQSASLACRHIWGFSFYEMAITEAMRPVDKAIQIMAVEAMEA